MDFCVCLSHTKIKEGKTNQQNQLPEENIEIPTEEKKDLSNSIHYGVYDVPIWYVSIILGTQHYLTMIAETVAYTYAITPYLCIRKDDPARGYLISTALFVSGICTFIQNTFGTRLPIIQGCSLSFLVPSISILCLPEWKCSIDLHSNHSFTQFELEEMWQSRIRLIQGSIACAAIFEVIIGFTGLMGFLLRWITPLAITPTIALVGLFLFEEAAGYASGNWSIFILTIILLVLFSQYLRNVKVFCFAYKKSEGYVKFNYPLFNVFSIFLTVSLTWILCAVLTVTNVLSKTNTARTDLKLSTLYKSPWFRFPYPGQWGVPTVTTSTVFGMLAAVLTSVFKCIGSFYACARMSGAPPPPINAINRGICIEGIGSIIAGLWGTGSGMMCYSENIGVIGITKVSSRRVIQFGALMMIVFGCISKFGAFFVTIPEPIIGGLFCVVFSMVTAVGLSNLQYVNLNSTRNLFILGLSLFLGLCIPKWINANPESIDTGVATIDQILKVLLGSSMFVAGFFGFVMDNSISGSIEEREILKTNKESNEGKDSSITTNECYQLPFISKLNFSFLSYIPICPSFNDKNETVKPKV